MSPFLEEYETASAKVRDFRAWMIAPSGKVKKFAKEEIFDVACAENDVYNECRRRVVSGKKDAEAGAVFAYEAVVERQLFSSQLLFHFQDSSPVRLARFTVTVPANREVKSMSFNGAPSEAAPAGGVYTWQMENLAAIEPEDASPGFLTLVPWVGVNLLGGSASHPVLTWPEAAIVLTGMNDGTAEPDDAIVAKAKALTAGAATELEKIRALGHFAQQVNYASIQVNLAKGGGYRPHSAAQVFRKLYGDCKDKANLMRALLQAVGISSYPVAIYSGDRTHVSAEWPSLGAFNHAITAIRVSPETQGPAVMVHPALGRLLLFDPTDPFVPAGYLPDHEQGSLALIGAGETGDLVRVPSAVAAAAARSAKRRRQPERSRRHSGFFSAKNEPAKNCPPPPGGISHKFADRLRQNDRALGRTQHARFADQQRGCAGRRLRVRAQRLVCLSRLCQKPAAGHVDFSRRHARPHRSLTFDRKNTKVSHRPRC